MSSTPTPKRALKPFTTSASSTQPTLAPHPLPAQIMSQPGDPSSAPSSSSNPRKRRLSGPITPSPIAPAPAPVPAQSAASYLSVMESFGPVSEPSVATPPAAKKGRTNTPWTPAEELRLKKMRDEGKSWSEIAKSFPARTEGSVKKHWYKDMHYAEFAEDESAALLAAIKEYEQNKWKVIGQKVGKPAKACESYAKEHFGGKI